MDKILYIANWKSHKTTDETKQFLDRLKERISSVNLADKQIIIAPSYTQLAECRRFIGDNNVQISLAAQNVSAYPQGAYTGEVNAGQLKEFVEYVIVGHSERRKYFNEEESDIENKIREATEAGIKVIQCIQDQNSIIHKGIEIVAYEPPSAIGSGNPDDPQHVIEVFKSIKEHRPEAILLYGGSVNPETISRYREILDLKGFLIGGASLDADSFISLLS